MNSSFRSLRRRRGLTLVELLVVVVILVMLVAVTIPLMRSMPKPGTSCECQGCDGKVVDGNPLTQMVNVALDGGARIVTVPVAEVQCGS